MNRVDHLRYYGHPFFSQMDRLKRFFDCLETLERQRDGRLQDQEIEFKCQSHRGVDVDWEDHADETLETGELECLHRLCQIMILYSTFESLIMKPPLLLWELDQEREEHKWTEQQFDAECRKHPSLTGPMVDHERAKRAAGSQGNLLICLLEESEKDGMESSVWPQRRAHFEVFTRLRNRLVHDGIDVTVKLREQVGKVHLHEIDEIPGDNDEAKLNAIAPVGGWVQVTREFVSTMYDLLEEVAGAVIILTESEVPDLRSELDRMTRRIFDERGSS